MPRKDRPHTTDGRYLVAKGILKRCTNPELGEAGPVWWEDNEPDFSGQHPAETPYATWWNSLSDTEKQAGM